ncbi:hypothetical protein I79_014949 [Cricetulus griseus]|uniref:Uncharacterized protein n=1 Tax=Cricetulus griseus TaxID=10029 RepID=G3HVG2_CRIGR|nr:hypothetical protein I79_014949 [Cricetulus griseus]
MKGIQVYKIQNTFLEAAGSLHFITKNTRALQAQPAYSHKLKLHQIVADGEKDGCLQIQQMEL